MDDPILHQSLPLKPWMAPNPERLPGLSPIPLDEWLVRDECFGAQMALRDHLVCDQRSKVLSVSEHVSRASQELLVMVRSAVGIPYGAKNWQRADGVTVDLGNDEHPLVTAGRLVQEDFAILDQQGDDWHLAEGLICFPSSWTVAQKTGRPLFDVHKPVSTYTENISTRINRILSNLQSDMVLMRANFLIYTDPSLHQPRLEGVEKPIDPHVPRFVRVERQTLRRLPESQAAVFTIHTYQVGASQLPGAEFDRLAELRPHLVENAN